MNNDEFDFDFGFKAGVELDGKLTPVEIKGRIFSNPFKHQGHYVAVVNKSVFCRDCNCVISVVYK